MIWIESIWRWSWSSEFSDLKAILHVRARRSERSLKGRRSESCIFWKPACKRKTCMIWILSEGDLDLLKAILHVSALHAKEIWIASIWLKATFWICDRIQKPAAGDLLKAIFDLQSERQPLVINDLWRQKYSENLHDLSLAIWRRSCMYEQGDLSLFCMHTLNVIWTEGFSDLWRFWRRSCIF